jgi:hypothetical protein
LRLGLSARASNLRGEKLTDNSEQLFYLDLARKEKHPDIRRYFKALSKFALPNDRERHLLQAEEIRSFLVQDDVLEQGSHVPRVLQYSSAQRIEEQEKELRLTGARGASVLQKNLDSAETLSEVGTLVLRDLMDQAGVPEKWLMPLKKRLRWVDGVEWTLDSAASLVGATRERLRQVVRKLDGFTIEVVATPKILFRVLSVANEVTDLDQLFARISGEGFSHTEDQWTKESLLELFHVVAKQAECEALSAAYRKLSPIPHSSKRDTLVRSLRSKDLGVFNLEEVASATNVPADEVLAVIRPLYQYVYSSDGIGIGIGKAPGTFVSLVGKQLLVNPEATPEILFVGIERYERYRRLEHKIAFQDFKKLLVLLFGEDTSLENLPTELQGGVFLSDFESRILKRFVETGRSQLHRKELESVAPEVGITAISAGVYLSHSPIIRPSPIRQGYYRLL